jgi:hypothetical protein
MWQDMFKTLGLGGMFFAAAAWLAKSLVSNKFARDAEQFRTQLKTSADIEIERLKGVLQMTALEHEVRFSKLHEQRAIVIDKLYKLMVEAPGPAWSLIIQDPSDQNHLAAAREKAFELYKFIQLNRLYFPDSICLLLDIFEQKLRSSVNRVGSYWRLPEPFNPGQRSERDQALLDACQALETELPTLRRQLEVEFRALLGGNK